MEKPHKILKKNEFIKFYLSEIDKQSMCNFCKYNSDNYTNMSKTLARLNRANKCSGCIHLYQNKITHKETIEKKRKLFNNFKPLYGWENITD